MSKKKPILSISLLASNRKDTTKKCLDSLKMIMDQLDSELIIVDTGCDEEMQALLHEYTDQVIPFTWCNDFSKARNAGVEKCTGEWFLYIDDDEWFENVDEIVDFFQSGEYNNYGQACYIQRNYSDLQGIRYSDSWVSRMTRLRKETHFCSSIHEYLEPVSGQTKLIHSHVNHYGYIFKSEEEKYRHSKRNVSLLLDMMKTERGNLRWWGQLAQEYAGIREYGQLVDLCVEGLEFIKDNNNPSVNVQRGLFYAGKIKAELASFRLEEARDDFETAIADRRNSGLCGAMLLSQGAEIYFRLKEYSKAKECAQKYLDLYDAWMEKGNTEERTMIEGTFFTKEAFERGTMIPVYSCLISCCLKEQDTSALKKYFDRLGWQDEDLRVSPLICKDIIDIFATLDYDEAFVKMADEMLSVTEIVDHIIGLLKAKEAESEEAFHRLLTIFSQVDCEHYYIWYMKLRYADRENETELLQESYEQLFSCVVDIFRLDNSVWEIAERRGIDLDALFVKVPFDHWKKGVDCFCEDTTLQSLYRINGVICRSQKSKNIRYDYLAAKMKEAMVVYGEDKDDYEKLRRHMSDFCKSTLDFYHSVFQSGEFIGEMAFLPASCRLAVRMQEVLETEDTTDAKEIVQAYEACLGVFSPMDSAIHAYIKLFGEKEQERLEALLEQQPLIQISELLGAVREAVEYLKQAPDSELQAGVQQHRETVEKLLEQHLGSPVQERIDSDNLSDEDWLLEMYRILDELEHPFDPENRMDIEFFEFIKDIWQTGTDQLFARMKESLMRMKARSGKNYNTFVQYFSEYPLWGSFDPENGDWQTLQLRAQVLKQRSYEFLWLYKRLEDALSKRTLFAILKNWAVLDTKEITAVRSVFPDYYEPDIFPDNKGDVFVDVGAYIGDSIQSYVWMYGWGYRKIYAFEISEDSVKALEKNTENYHDVTVIQKGAGAEKSVMYINTNSVSGSANRAESKADDATGTAVEIVAIDEELDETPTFIKMDIEGAEQGALLGCQKTITEVHPKLAICTYHGYEDIWKIPFMIDSMYSDYKFYMRHYGGNLVPSEFVLFCRAENE